MISNLGRFHNIVYTLLRVFIVQPYLIIVIFVT